jgi:CheY-like chemotaxis protein
MNAPERKCLIYVDDDPDDVELFKEYFENFDTITVITFPNGKVLLEFLDTLADDQWPSLLVLDVNTPVMTGWQTLHELKTSPKYRLIPAVMFSTSRYEAEFSKYVHYGIETLTKPVNSMEAEKIVQQLLKYFNGEQG